MERGTVAQLAADFHPIDHEFLNVVLFHFIHELRGLEFCVFLAVARALDHLPQQSAETPISNQNSTVFTVEFT